MDKPHLISVEAIDGQFHPIDQAHCFKLTDADGNGVTAWVPYRDPRVNQIADWIEANCTIFTTHGSTEDRSTYAVAKEDLVGFKLTWF